MAQFPSCIVTADTTNPEPHETATPATTWAASSPVLGHTWQSVLKSISSNLSGSPRSRSAAQTRPPPVGVSVWLSRWFSSQLLNKYQANAINLQRNLKLIAPGAASRQRELTWTRTLSTSLHWGFAVHHLYLLSSACICSAVDSRKEREQTGLFELIQERKETSRPTFSSLK